MSETAAKRRSLNVKERFRLFEILKEHCRTGSDGTARYDEGWSDKRVAETLSAELSPDNPITTYPVQRVREEVFGPMPARPGEAGPLDAVREEIAHLRERVTALEAMAHGPGAVEVASVSGPVDCTGPSEMLRLMDADPRLDLALETYPMWAKAGKS